MKKIISRVASAGGLLIKRFVHWIENPVPSPDIVVGGIYYTLLGTGFLWGSFQGAQLIWAVALFFIGGLMISFGLAITWFGVKALQKLAKEDATNLRSNNHQPART